MFQVGQNNVAQGNEQRKQQIQQLAQQLAQTFASAHAGHMAGGFNDQGFSDGGMSIGDFLRRRQQQRMNGALTGAARPAGAGRPTAGTAMIGGMSPGGGPGNSQLSPGAPNQGGANSRILGTPALQAGHGNYGRGVRSGGSPIGGGINPGGPMQGAHPANPLSPFAPGGSANPIPSTPAAAGGGALPPSGLPAQVGLGNALAGGPNGAGLIPLTGGFFYDPTSGNIYGGGPSAGVGGIHPGAQLGG